MIIDTNKEFSQQTEEVQEEIRNLLQKEMQRRRANGEGYPSFNNEGGFTIEMQYTDKNGKTFLLTEKRVHNNPFFRKDISVKSRNYYIKKL